MTNSQRGERTQQIHQGLNSSSGSYELVLAAVILGVIGFGLDSLLGTLPLLTVVLASVGFLGAAASIYYRYRYNMDRASQARAEAAAQ